LDSECDAAKRAGRHGVLLDFENVKSASTSTLAALVELVGRHPALDFGFCAPNDKIQRRIADTGIDRQINCFSTTKAAVASPRFQRFALTTTRAILDVPMATAQLAKMSGATTIAEIDVLGRPVVEHFLANLSRFGLNVALIHGSPAAIDLIKRTLVEFDHKMSLFFAPLGSRQLGRPGTESAATILSENFPTHKSALIASIDGIRRLEMPQIEAHFSDAVLADAPNAALCGASTVLQNSLKPGSGFSFMTKAAWEDARAKTTGQKEVLSLDPSAPSPLPTRPKKPFVKGLSSPATYFSTLRLASKKIVTDLDPAGEEVDAGIWRAAGAKISARSRLSGFCYVGTHASVAPEAALKTFTVVAAKGTVERRALLEECIVLPAARALANKIHRNCAIFENGLGRLQELPNTAKPSGALQGTSKALLGVA
jgi:hypothetical protein